MWLMSDTGGVCFVAACLTAALVLACLLGA
jgi:hypothetical protein